MLVLRPNEFTQPDYTVILKHGDGAEEAVGRIYCSISVSARGETPWFWSIYGTSYQGICESREAAMDIFRRRWNATEAHRTVEDGTTET